MHPHIAVISHTANLGSQIGRYQQVNADVVSNKAKKSYFSFLNGGTIRPFRYLSIQHQMSKEELSSRSCQWRAAPGINGIFQMSI